MSVAHGRHPAVQVLRTREQAADERARVTAEARSSQRPRPVFVFDTSSLLHLRAGLARMDATQSDLALVFAYLAGRAVITPAIRAEFVRVSKHRKVPRDIVNSRWKVPAHDTSGPVDRWVRNNDLPTIKNRQVDKQLIALARLRGVTPIMDDAEAAFKCWELSSVRPLSTREFVLAFNAATGSSTKMAGVEDVLGRSSNDAARNQAAALPGLEWGRLVMNLAPPERLQLEARPTSAARGL